MSGESSDMLFKLYIASIARDPQDLLNVWQSRFTILSFRFCLIKTLITMLSFLLPEL